METVKKVAEEWNVVKKHEAHHHLGEGINHSDEDYSTKEEKAAHADQSDSSAETQLQQSNVKKSEDLTKTTSSEDSVGSGCHNNDIEKSALNSPTCEDEAKGDAKPREYAPVGITCEDEAKDDAKPDECEPVVVITTEEKQESDSNPRAVGLVIVERSFNITARGSTSPTVGTGSPGQVH